MAEDSTCRMNYAYLSKCVHILASIIFVSSFVSSVFLFYPHIVVSAEIYSLGDLYRLALGRSETVKLSEEDLRIARLERGRALSVLIPTVSGFGSYTQYTEDKRSTTGSVMQPDYNNAWGVKLEQSISVSGRELIALDAAGDNIKKSGFDLQAVKENYLARVSESYFKVLQAGEALRIADSNLERLKKYLEAAEKRLKIGEATKTAVLRAKGEMSGALSERINAGNSYAMARVDLSRVVGLEGDFQLSEPDAAPVENSSLAELQSMALKDRYELKSLDMQRRIAEKEIEYKRGALWPTASLEGVYSRLDQNPKSPSGYNDEAVSAALSLNFPLYDGGLRRLDISEAATRKRQIDLLYMDEEKSVKVEVENSWLEVGAQKGVIKYLEDQLTYATSNYYSVLKQFEFGLSDSIDLIDANNLLLTSQLKLSDAKYNYQLSLLKLKRAVGALLNEVESTP